MVSCILAMDAVGVRFPLDVLFCVSAALSRSRKVGRKAGKVDILLGRLVGRSVAGTLAVGSDGGETPLAFWSRSAPLEVWRDT